MTPNAYLPGQSVRFLSTANLLGALYSPVATIVVTVHGPLVPGATKITQTLTPIVDSLGKLHVDTVIPLTAIPGPYVARWVATGSGPSDTSSGEDLFIVQALSY